MPARGDQFDGHQHPGRDDRLDELVGGQRRVGGILLHPAGRLDGLAGGRNSGRPHRAHAAPAVYSSTMIPEEAGGPPARNSRGSGARSTAAATGPAGSVGPSIMA